jgi:hypothetical protein
MPSDTTDSEDIISATCFVPLQNSLIENATMMAKLYCHAYPMGTDKLAISKSGLFPLSAPVS